MKITSDIVIENLDIMIPNVRCELNYSKDYELLIAVVLSAQSTDKRVNMVTKELFDKYNLYSLAEANLLDVETIIRPVGTFKRKATYIVNIAKSLVRDYEGMVPNNREYLESLPGVGRKTCNVVLSNIYDVPTIAVDTHVSRVSKRLNLVSFKDEVDVIEKKLMKKFPEDQWSKLHHQMVLFGRYICKSKKPDCNNCLFQEICMYKKTSSI